MYFIILLTTLLLATSPITALTEAQDRGKGDCALGVLNVDASGQVTGCGNALVPIGSRGEYSGLGGRL